MLNLIIVAIQSVFAALENNPLKRDGFFATSGHLNDAASSISVSAEVGNLISQFHYNTKNYSLYTVHKSPRSEYYQAVVMRGFQTLYDIPGIEKRRTKFVITTEIPGFALLESQFNGFLDVHSEFAGERRCVYTVRQSELPRIIGDLDPIYDKFEGGLHHLSHIGANIDIFDSAGITQLYYDVSGGVAARKTFIAFLPISDEEYDRLMQKRSEQQLHLVVNLLWIIRTPSLRTILLNSLSLVKGCCDLVAEYANLSDVDWVISHLQRSKQSHPSSS